MYELIDCRVLTGNASSIVFSNIPQIYSDLFLITSLRDNNAATGWENAFIYPNGSSSNMVSRAAYGWSTNVGSLVNSPAVLYHQTARGGNTANTFSSSAVYIQNYTSSSAKNFSCETSVERNDVAGINAITAGLWSSSSAITSLEIVAASGVGESNSFVAGSSATLYGVNRTALIGRPSKPKAIGGAITYANGYWVHTFNGSGSLTVTEELVAEYLVVGGGGGAGPAFGGGGAGGYRSSVVGEMSGGGASNESQLVLTAGASYPVIVGAGAARNAAGSNSVFATITSLGGGYGGTGNGRDAGSGGSGGGGSSSWTANNNGGAGTTGQGYAGGYATAVYYVDHGGGGGGAGGAGASTSGDNGGNGGVGVQSSITGTAVYRAGGGAGGTVQGSTGTSGLGTGANTGGGGYTASNLGAGHSGVVIIRYRAD